MNITKQEKFSDWWFNKLGEEEAFEKYAHLITEREIRKQPSWPNRENAITEAVWNRALKAFTSS